MSIWKEMSSAGLYIKYFQGEISWGHVDVVKSDNQAYLRRKA